MSEIPNPLAAFDIFTSKVKNKKNKARGLKKLLSKKLAKKLFGKTFATNTRAELAKVEEVLPEKIHSKPKKPSFEIAWASTANEIKEAQRLRYKVFAEEMGAHLPKNSDGLDVDEFDAYCDHLIVRDRETLQVVGTYRVLAPEQAKAIGRLYSASEFDLARLEHLLPKTVEIGRSCVHEDYRSGAVIMALWAGLGAYMKQHGYEIMLGCASVPMGDGGHYAASLNRILQEKHSSSIEYRTFPKLPLPLDKLNSMLEVEPPPLLKGYLRIGAKICGEPAWDPDFNTADFLTMFRLSDMNPKYAKHFLAEH